NQFRPGETITSHLQPIHHTHTHTHTHKITSPSNALIHIQTLNHTTTFLSNALTHTKTHTHTHTNYPSNALLVQWANTQHQQTEITENQSAKSLLKEQTTTHKSIQSSK